MQQTCKSGRSGQCVILDGNERAQQFQLALIAGTIPGETMVRIITVELNLGVVLVAKALSSLWR
jgi:hypothetical protein